jgi:hypothetical protein
MTTTATETKFLVLLRHHLKALRLPTIGAECEKVARQAAADNSDHRNYLLQLAELELLEYERRAAERRLKTAKFPTLKSLDTFDYTARPSVNKAMIAEIRDIGRSQPACRPSGCLATRRTASQRHLEFAAGMQLVESGQELVTLVRSATMARSWATPPLR